MSSILLRKLTLKSKLNFGKYKNCTVEQMFGMRMQKQLISIYFKLSKITFTDDILTQLGIVAEFRISKPSKNIELYLLFLEQNNYQKKRPQAKGLQKMRIIQKPFRPETLLRINHGHRLIY